MAAERSSMPQDPPPPPPPHPLTSLLRPPEAGQDRFFATTNSPRRRKSKRPAHPPPLFARNKPHPAAPAQPFCPPAPTLRRQKTSACSPHSTSFPAPSSKVT